MKEFLIIFFSVLGGVIFSTLLISLICFFLAFYAPKRKSNDDTFSLPLGDLYEPWQDDILAWVKMARSCEHKDFSIKSYDGLTLRGKYYEYKRGAPIEILFNGYRGDAERDLSGAIERCFALERNALIVNQRACGTSDGHIITFGAKERLDCALWAEFVAKELGSDVPIILTGVSLGASTVLLASELELPKNVACILADCPYSSAKKIIKTVIRRDMHLPASIIYPFVYLGALLFGGFKISDGDAVRAVKNSKIPIIFIHGDNDAFVPCEMSRELYDACASKKSLVFIKGAGHGLAYPVDKEHYLSALRDFEPTWKSKE